MGYLERRRGAVGFSAAAVLALAAVARRRFCTALPPTCRRAVGFCIPVPGLYRFFTSIPHQSPQMIAASTMITEKGEGELGNVE